MGAQLQGKKNPTVADIYNRQLLERVQHGSDKVDVGKIAFFRTKSVMKRTTFDPASSFRHVP